MGLLPEAERAKMLAYVEQETPSDPATFQPGAKAPAPESKVEGGANEMAVEKPAPVTAKAPAKEPAPEAAAVETPETLSLELSDGRKLTVAAADYHRFAALGAQIGDAEAVDEYLQFRGMLNRDPTLLQGVQTLLGRPDLAKAVVAAAAKREGTVEGAETKNGQSAARTFTEEDVQRIVDERIKQAGVSGQGSPAQQFEARVDAYAKSYPVLSSVPREAMLEMVHAKTSRGIPLSRAVLDVATAFEAHGLSDTKGKVERNGKAKALQGAGKQASAGPTSLTPKPEMTRHDLMTGGVLRNVLRELGQQ